MVRGDEGRERGARRRLHGDVEEQLAQRGRHAPAHLVGRIPQAGRQHAHHACAPHAQPPALAGAPHRATRAAQDPVTCSWERQNVLQSATCKGTRTLQSHGIERTYAMQSSEWMQMRAAPMIVCGDTCGRAVVTP